MNNEGGENINMLITIALKKYNKLNKIFFEYFVPKYPIPKVPTILNNPIKDKIIVGDHKSIPLSFI